MSGDTPTPGDSNTEAQLPISQLPTCEKALAIIKDFSSRHGITHRYLYLVDDMIQRGLNIQQIAAAIQSIEATCPHCWDAPRGCYCNDDE